ncbi:peptidyl-prolyl cis-trans isomerase [Leptospira sarikeiensis]|uniref:peptidylprolyl isomerase n=1 Tax=Leptospira sarikeiensis TaxID=2484943 RepID=A0A4R9KBW4_9LEPT|nr:peptidylprolyl isomerase [Leptospira sarikeiensis]TGL64247.1 peptidyl-prolyl cis-trans isomerase [Leptospira sarikeiensis]
MKLEYKSETLPGLLLGLGSFFGFSLALIGLLFPNIENSFEDIAADVNGVRIGKEEYLRALAGYSSDSKNPLTNEIRANVLERLIEEELLVQRGLELGFASQDKQIRAGLVRSVIQSAISEISAEEPSELELRFYYLSHKEKFFSTPRYKVLAYEEAEEKKAILLSEEWKKNGKIQNGTIVPLPDSPLPPRKLLDYLGPFATAALENLQTGEVSLPLRSGNKFLILKILSLEPGNIPKFGEIKEEIKTEYKQDKEDKSLREYLDLLKRKSKIKRFPL